jgi:hypothetical protein
VISKTRIYRILCYSSRISDAGSDNARQDAELGVRPPESPQCKGCGFCARRGSCIYWRDPFFNVSLAHPR